MFKFLTNLFNRNHVDVSDESKTESEIFRLESEKNIEKLWAVFRACERKAVDRGFLEIGYFCLCKKALKALERLGEREKVVAILREWIFMEDRGGLTLDDLFLDLKYVPETEREKRAFGALGLHRTTQTSRFGLHYSPASRREREANARELIALWRAHPADVGIVFRKARQDIVSPHEDEDLPSSDCGTKNHRDIGLGISI
jgi:hypothetical protein